MPRAIADYRNCFPGVIAIKPAETLASAFYHLHATIG